MCSSDLPRAFAKAMLGASTSLPTSGTVFVSVADRDKRALVLPVKLLTDMGFTIVATAGTAAVLSRYGIAAQTIAKHFEASEGEQSVLDRIVERGFDLVVNVPGGRQERADGYEIRAAATVSNVPLLTTVDELSAAVSAIESLQTEAMDVRALQEWA